MSLIREALEKARREGQRPESATREPQYPTTPTTGPWRAHRREERPTWPRTLAIVLASVAASGALTVFLIRRGDETLIPAPTPVQTEPVAPAVPTPMPVVAPSPPPVAAAAPAQNVRLRAGLRNSPSAQTVLAPSSSEHSVPAAPSRPPTAVITAPATPELHLDGIVASATNPVAVVNGRLLGLGETIEGYKVIRIENNEVELEKDGAKTVLRLR
jgi:hypothetical protein